MPEIAEVRVVASTLKRQILNKKIKKVKILYPNIIIGDKNEFSKNLTGKKLKDIKTFGKWLLFDFGEFTLLSHLRMEGKYFHIPSINEIKKHDHIIFTFDDDMDLRYNDVRKFGKMELVKTEDVFRTASLSKLGYEPEDKNLTAHYLTQKFKNKKKTIKTLLLDQTIINGLGNIYANEVLFAAGISPLREAQTVSLEEAENIIKSSRKIITKSFELGGCTIKSYTSSLGVTGKYQNELKVHMRDKIPCIICKNPIKKIKIDGRSSYYCEKCQK